MNTKKFKIALMLILLLVFIVWDLLFVNFEKIHLIGVSIIPVILGVLSVSLLFSASKKGRETTFWIILMAASTFSIIGGFIWTLSDAFRSNGSLIVISNTIWALSYILFLIALIEKMRKLGFKFKNKNYLFNIMIYLVTTISVSYYFLIVPYISNPHLHAFKNFFTILYQIIDLGIFFFCLILIYLIVTYRVEKTFLFLIGGLLIKLGSDILIVMIDSDVGYSPGGVIDFLWMASTAFVGAAALFTKGDDSANNSLVFSTDRNDFYLPISSAIILAILVLQSYRWEINVLSFALMFTFFMTIGRQYKVIYENKKLFKEMQHLALHDSLTGTGNRYSFMKDLKNSINDNNCVIALLLIDLDRFKNINDTLGHLAGDQVLITVTNRINHVLTKGETLYRLGGDEFVIVSHNTSKEKTILLGNLILSTFLSDFKVMGHHVSITPSIGISFFPDHTENEEELLKFADVAMYRAKENGKNNFVLYDSELMKTTIRKMDIENELKHAVERNQFSLVFQSKIDLKKNQICGVEALLRWENPKLGVVSPMEFIPIAEETGLIIDIGAWVLTKSCKQMKRWQDNNIMISNISVNVSVLQLRDDSFLTQVEHSLNSSGLNANVLEFEITETIMQNTADTVKVLEGLKKLGVRTSIDDFGTGYSSLHVLQQLPIDALKIDKSFVMSLNESDTSPMVKTIIELGQNLGLDIVAEGIETEYQLKFLEQHGCNIGQGYIISKPLNTKEFERFFQFHKTEPAI